MARLVINPAETWEYVLPDDRDEHGNAKPGEPVFVFGHLTNSIRQQIQDKVVGYRMNDKGADEKADVLIKTGTRDRLAVQFGLRDVKIGGATPEWFKRAHMPAWGTQGVTDGTLDVLRYHLDTLGNEAWSRSILSEQDEKNSVALST